MELLRVTSENIETEHICCTVSNNKDAQVASKKEWMKERFADGLVFLKCNVRGKCFIEYIPAENAWAPIYAPDYMYINCFWIAGQFKGHGYSNLLLDECIRDSRGKGKKGLVILSSKKKQSFLSDPKYLRHKGFELADCAPPYFELMYLPFEKGAEKPRFYPYVGAPERGDIPDGFVIYYTSQCPFNAKYIPLLEAKARELGVKLTAMHIKTKEQAQSAKSPFTTFSLFHNGEFVTHEILSEAKLEKIISKRQKRLI